MKKIAAVICVGLSLSACVTQEQVKKVMDSQRPVTASEKAAIVNKARDYFFDPIRSAMPRFPMLLRWGIQG